jgi:hypothetical protein
MDHTAGFMQDHGRSGNVLMVSLRGIIRNIFDNILFLRNVDSEAIRRMGKWVRS